MILRNANPVWGRMDSPNRGRTGPSGTFKRKTQPCKEYAFTLIELLVVIAIISLLVSILLPSLQKSRDLAKETACLHNLHGWSLTLNLYAGENENRLLIQMYHPVDGWYRTWEPWMEELGYVENRNMNRCPAEEGTEEDDVTYISNALLWGFGKHDRSVEPEFVNGIIDDVKTRPESSIVMAEHPHKFNQIPGWPCARFEHFHTWPMHRGSCNFLFLDNHCEWVEYTGDYTVTAVPENFTVDEALQLWKEHWRVGISPN